jgi:histidine triad (HIT) family protein
MACIFCKIVEGKISSPRVYEDEKAIVIRDLHPQAKTHFLVIPKVHVESLAALFENSDEGKSVIGDLFAIADTVAKTEGLLPDGFRSVINTGVNGGQSVFHLHLHLLGGEKLPERFV